MTPYPNWYVDHLIIALECRLAQRRARELEREAAEKIARLIVRETRERPTRAALDVVRRHGLLSR